MLKKILAIILILLTGFIVINVGIKKSDRIKEIQVQTEIKPNLVSHFKLDSIAMDQILSFDDLKSGLESIEKNIWAEIKETYNLNQEEFIQRRTAMYEEYKTSIQEMSKRYSKGLKALEKSTIDFIQAIMKECNVNPEHVQLVPWGDHLHASATDIVIFINEAMFNALSYETKKFTIGHELIHVINKDHSTRWTIRNTDPVKTVHDNEKSPLNKLCKFHELRADIMCSINGEEFSKGAIVFMQDQIKKYGELQECNRASYPTYAMREAINTKILNLHAITNKSVA